jgi:hypothetical protein
VSHPPHRLPWAVCVCVPPVVVAWRPFVESDTACAPPPPAKWSLPALPRPLFLHTHTDPSSPQKHSDVSLENVLLASWGQPEGEPAAHLIDLGSCCLTGLSGMCPVADFTYRGKYSYASPEVLPESMLETPPNALLDPFAVDVSRASRPTPAQLSYKAFRTFPPGQHSTPLGPSTHLRPSTHPQVWSLGILLYALQTGHPLYVGPEDGAFSMLCEGRASELLTHYENFGLVGALSLPSPPPSPPPSLALPPCSTTPHTHAICRCKRLNLHVHARTLSLPQHTHTRSGGTHHLHLAGS